jgi:pyruvate,orthophosphate dikinase
MAGSRGADALREVVAKVAEGELTRHEAILRITADDLDQVLHAQFASDGDVVLAKGLGASPGAAVGRVYFTADDCATAADRGERVVLVRTETSPEDVHGMQLAEGILTTRGGLASHAAVVARGWGIPAVVGAEAVQIGERSFTVGDVTVHEGDVISLDGATGEVVAGERGVARAEPPPELDTVLAWADEVRGDRIGVRANADNGADAAVAVAFGAEGIGLCRTEHKFLAEGRLPVVRAMLLATDPAAEAAALEELRAAQRDDFAEILRALAGRPLTVRLLDLPLHEFLPAAEDLRVARAERPLTAEQDSLLAAAEAWHEHNPMLGTRGVRLAALKPGLYEMQVRALVEAALAEREAGGTPSVEVMIPLTINGAELARARGWVEAAIADTPGAASLAVAIGTMVETPRAALVAGELAAVADFFSFGTNDLTQMTYGFSRDDVEARLVPEYLTAGILPANPFETLDPQGVGALVALAVERGRAARPDLKLGVCGEHGGDPASIAQLVQMGVGYVSCSPYRIPVARLAAAQAILEGEPPADDAR